VKRFIPLILLALTGCTRPEHARKVLADQGFKDITITGYSWFSCGKDDSFSTGFEATSANGAKVKGTVCEGMLFKNATVRYE
jgi:hypothetical protein